MDHNVADAMEYFRKGEPYDYQHECTSCEQGFDNGFGIQVDGTEKFCNECIGAGAHKEFYREECGLSAAETERLLAEKSIELTNKQK